MNTLQMKYFSLFFIFFIFGQSGFGQTAEDWYKKGVTSYEAKKFEDGIVFFTRAIENGHIPLKCAYYYRGNAKRDLGKTLEAIDDYDKAIKLDPDYTYAYNNRGVAKENLGKSQDAINDFDKVIQLNPNYAHAYYNRGIAKMTLNKSQDAIDDFDKAIQLRLADADVYCRRGASKQSLDKYQDAIDDYDKAIQLNPDDAFAYNNRGVSKQNLGKYQDAIDDYDKAIQLDPDYTEVYYSRGASKQNLGKYQDAIDDYDKAIQLNPDDTFAYNNRGYAYLQLKNYQKAIENWEMMKKVAKSDYIPYFNYIDEARAKLAALNEKPSLYIFIVGIENYTSCFARLNYSTDDAYYLQKYFISQKGMAIPDENIKLITDNKATKDNILYELKLHADKAKENDLFIFFFSGHGVEGHLVPYNNICNEKSSFIKHSDISNYLKKCKAKNKFLLFDSCNSSEKGAPKLEEQFNKDLKTSKGALSVLLSSSSDQSSLESDGAQHGYFTHFLIKGMEGEADENKNGIVTLGELSKYVTFEVQTGTNNSQIPQLIEGADENLPISIVKK
jgi:tetratricopeptide (TPR) repeat protein